MDKTAKLIRWQRITTPTLCVCFACASYSCAGCAPKKEAIQPVKAGPVPSQTPVTAGTPLTPQPLSPFATQTAPPLAATTAIGLSEADIEYLRWFKQYDQNVTTMVQQQQTQTATILNTMANELMSKTAASQSQAASATTATDPTAAAKTMAQNWSQAIAIFQQKRPPANFLNVENAYMPALALTASIMSEQANKIGSIASAESQAGTPQEQQKAYAALQSLMQEQQGATGQAQGQQRQIAAYKQETNVQLVNCLTRGGSSVPPDLIGLQIK